MKLAQPDDQGPGNSQPGREFVRARPRFRGCRAGPSTNGSMQARRDNGQHASSSSYQRYSGVGRHCSMFNEQYLPSATACPVEDMLKLLFGGVHVMAVASSARRVRLPGRAVGRRHARHGGAPSKGQSCDERIAPRSMLCRRCRRRRSRDEGRTLQAPARLPTTGGRAHRTQYFEIGNRAIYHDAVRPRTLHKATGNEPSPRHDDKRRAQ